MNTFAVGLLDIERCCILLGYYIRVVIPAKSHRIIAGMEESLLSHFRRPQERLEGNYGTKLRSLEFCP